MRVSARVLIVEDESIVAMLLETMLSDLGYEVVAIAPNLAAGTDLASGADFDFAVLDVSLGGVKSYPIAEQLRARGIPFLFATGYGASGLDDAWRTAPTLLKPFEETSLDTAITRLLSAPAADDAVNI